MYSKGEIASYPKFLLSPSSTTTEYLARHKTVLNKGDSPTSMEVVNRGNKWKVCAAPLKEKGVPDFHLFAPFPLTEYKLF